MIQPRFLLTLAAALSAFSVRAELSLVSSVTIPGGGEVVAHYNNPSGPDYVLVTNSLPRTGEASHKIDVFALGANGALTFAASANFDNIFGAAATLGLSSVAADPLGRGFGAASIIPNDNTGTRGKVAFFNLATGTILYAVDVGFHPDAVKFSPDGSKLVVANEGEFKAPTHAAGSVSVLQLTTVAGPSGFTLALPVVTTIDFNTGLAAGVSLAALRINVADAPAADRYLHVEPEFPAVTNEKAYLTLQENNAIAVIDLAGANANKVTAILPLGTIVQRIDASDRDPQNGGIAAININDIVPGLPMPDTIVTFTHNGRRLLATANEGDARTDDGDIARAGAAGVVDVVADSVSDAIFSGSLSDSAGIGRLNISRVDGNTDGDALIEVPTMIGTRSFTLWDEAGNRVFDSGSMLEEFVRSNFPLTFNMNNGAASGIDSRSDDKGPEPEALAHGMIDGRHYLFVGAERQNGLFQFDITDLSRVAIVGYYNVVNGTTLATGTTLVSPETLVFVPATESPTGRPILIAGYEGVPDSNIPGSVAVLEITSSVSRISNGSLRTTIAANQSLIGGFNLVGTSTMVVRGVGPTLANFGVSGVVADPALALFSGSTEVATNDDWATSSSPAFAAVGAFPLGGGSRDAAIVRSVTGNHTLRLDARAGGSAMIELYHQNENGTSRLTNISGRSRIGGPGELLIGGFVISGTGTREVLIRAVGARLGNFGVSGALADPQLTVYRGNVKVGENDDWATGTTAADFTASGAFGLDTDTKSAAVKLTLTAGAAYTVHVGGNGGTAGEVLLEIYELP